MIKLLPLGFKFACVRVFVCWGGDILCLCVFLHTVYNWDFDPFVHLLLYNFHIVVVAEFVKCKLLLLLVLLLLLCRGPYSKHSSTLPYNFWNILAQQNTFTQNPQRSTKCTILEDCLIDICMQCAAVLTLRLDSV